MCGLTLWLTFTLCLHYEIFKNFRDNSNSVVGQWQQSGGTVPDSPGLVEAIGGGGGGEQASSLSSKHKLWNFHRFWLVY